ncbi:MAG TPA: EAL domain-containing protein [Kineosporiaceae bacterium]|nr:EAL domain-containing protein [Kineosporiaceae bacterium]
MAIATGVLALAGGSAVMLPAPATAPGTIRPAWWLLALGFAAAQLWPLRIRLDRREHVVTVGQVPFVIGLFSLAPGWLLVARLLGTGAALALLHRRRPLRLAFTLAALGLQTALAAALLLPAVGHAGALSTRGWLAGLVATGAATVADCAVVLLAGAWLLPAGDGARAGELLPRALSTAAVTGLGGMVGAAALALGRPALLPSGLALLALVLAYQLYVLLLERHDNQERLLRLSDRLRAAAGVEDVSRLVAGHVAALVGSQYVELVIGRRGRFVGWSAGSDTPTTTGSAAAPAGPVTPAAGLRPAWSAGDGEPGATPGSWDDTGGIAGLFRTPAGGLAIPPTPAEGFTVPDGEAVVAAAARLRIVCGLDCGADRLLATRNLHEAIVLELAVGEGLSAALLVGQRAGHPLWQGYRDHDLRLLQAVGHQATLALRHALALERLCHADTHDQLTGLPNRAEFRRHAVHAVAEAAAHGPGCAIGVIDLDGFKTVNDSLGHLAGDAVLAEVGRRLGRLGREGVQVSRLGGDEFAVLIRDVREESDAVGTARRLLDALHEPFEVLGDQVRLTGSVGLALAPRDGLTPEHLLRHADVAMYAAKEETGGVRVYARELTEMMDAPLSLAADLRLALTRGDVRIAVQPLVDLASGRLHSVEALARWRHPVLGVVNPEAFVMAAERVGLIGELTDVVIDQALRACQGWLHSGMEVQVAVNLAARTLSDPELPAKVEAALHRYGVPGRLLCLELTETGVISSPDRALAVLSRLRELGVGLAVDDFGTGYSSMTYMNWLAPDQVKIDKSFVQRLLFDPRNEAIVRSIIDLAHNLGVDVVAEGVGDARTATRLADLGCTIGQGFLFAEPMPIEDLPDWVARWMSVPERDELPEAERCGGDEPADRTGDQVIGSAAEGPAAQPTGELVVDLGQAATSVAEALDAVTSDPAVLDVVAQDCGGLDAVAVGDGRLRTGPIKLGVPGAGPGAGSPSGPSTGPIPAQSPGSVLRRVSGPGDDGEGEVRLHVVR